MPKILFFLLCAALALLTLSISGHAQTVEDRSIEIVQTDPAHFPRRLERAGVTRGEAWVALSVDPQGALLDVLVTGYTRQEFADEAVAALRRWQFKPAVVAGTPVTAVREMRFRFSRAGVAIENLTGIDVLSRALERSALDHMSFRALALRELDRIPTPVKVIKPRMPEALAISRGAAVVTVEFYIDETGNVRMPAALDRALSDHACEAVDAVRQWKFEVPTAHGKPALALVRQKFRFDPTN